MKCDEKRLQEARARIAELEAGAPNVQRKILVMRCQTGHGYAVIDGEGAPPEDCPECRRHGRLVVPVLGGPARVFEKVPIDLGARIGTVPAWSRTASTMAQQEAAERAAGTGEKA